MLLFTCWMGFKLIDRHGFVLYFELKTTFEEYGVELRYYSLGSKWTVVVAYAWLNWSYLRRMKTQNM